MPIDFSDYRPVPFRASVDRPAWIDVTRCHSELFETTLYYATLSYTTLDSSGVGDRSIRVRDVASTQCTISIPRLYVGVDVTIECHREGDTKICSPKTHRKKLTM